MRIVFTTLTGLCFISVGYVYPFLVRFRNGPFESVIGKSWLMQLALIIVISEGVPKFVAMVNPEFAREMIVDRWVPDSPSIVPIMILGWMTPLIGGGLGLIARRFFLRRFPEWMNRISIPPEPDKIA